MTFFSFGDIILIFLMLVKKINTKHYKKVKRLIQSNNSKIPSFNYWFRLFNKPFNISCDGFIEKGRLVGYHSYFQKIIIFKNKKYKALISSNWCVTREFRKESIKLLLKYFRKKADLFITTTANSNVANIWKLYGAREVNINFTNKVFFKILNYKKFFFFILKEKKYLVTFIYPISFFFYYLFYFKRPKKQNVIKIYRTKKFSNISKFNQNYEKKKVSPCETRKNKYLKNYIKIIKHNKDILMYEIFYRNKMIGYCIVAVEKIKKTNFCRAYLADIRVGNTYSKYINSILNAISFEINYKKVAFVEFKNLNPTLQKNLNEREFFFRKYNFIPYLIKFNKTSKELVKFSENKWHTSYLDGDCLL